MEVDSLLCGGGGGGAARTCKFLIRMIKENNANIASVVGINHSSTNINSMAKC
jgi:hypothetical protein